MTGALNFYGGEPLVGGFAVFDRAAAFAFTGVFTGATVVTALAAALAFAGVLAGTAVVGIGFRFIVGEDAGEAGGLAGLGGGRRGVGRGEEAAGEDAGEGGTGKERFRGGLAFHSSSFFLVWFWFSARSRFRDIRSAADKNGHQTMR